MKTVNVEINNKSWHNVEELIGVNFQLKDTFTITFKNCFKGEICKSDSMPTENFIGHPVKNDENFSYEHNESLKVFIKAYPLSEEQKCVLIIS